MVNYLICSDTFGLHSPSVKRLRDGGRRAPEENQKIYPAQMSRAEGRRYCALQWQGTHDITHISARGAAGKAWKTTLTGHCKNCHAICNMKIWKPQPYGNPKKHDIIALGLVSSLSTKRSLKNLWSPSSSSTRTIQPNNQRNNSREKMLRRPGSMAL